MNRRSFLGGGLTAALASMLPARGRARQVVTPLARRPEGLPGAIEVEILPLGPGDRDPWWVLATHDNTYDDLRLSLVAAHRYHLEWWERARRGPEDFLYNRSGTMTRVLPNGRAQNRMLWARAPAGETVDSYLLSLLGQGGLPGDGQTTAAIERAWRAEVGTEDQEVPDSPAWRNQTWTPRCAPKPAAV